MPFLRYAKEITLSHQEKWNGKGYPQGLAGEQIPISARLMAVADVYDALISKRAYKPAFSHEKAFDIIRIGSGSHFDPDVVEAFLGIAEEFRRIAQRYIDDEAVLANQVERLANDLPAEHIDLDSTL
jgi:putative two-component system response regulator